MKKKKRADILLYERGLCESREKARRLIMAGEARVGEDYVIRKSSEQIPIDADIKIEKRSEYVSRGAYKLLPALDKHLPELKGMIGLDIGASTGGFTDVMIRKGIEKVYSVDVGYGQLHYRLRMHPKVVCYEKVNARYVKPDFLPEKVDIITIDVSFISVTKILPAVTRLTKQEAWAFILVKPQFETERENVEKGGVVRDETLRLQTVEKIVNFMEYELPGQAGKWRNIDVLRSPIKGPKGNVEYMTVFRREL